MVKIKHMDWFKAGAIEGGLLAVLLPLLASLPTFGITFSIYNIRDNLAAAVGSGSIFGQYLLQFVGDFTLPGFLVAALGFGVLTILARYLVEMIPKVSAKMKMPLVFFLAALLQGVIMSLQLPAFELMPLLFLGLTAYLLSFLLKLIYKKVLKKQLPA